MVDLYLDEHVAAAVAKALRKRDVDVLTTPETGMIGASDRDHLAPASSENRVLFTRDADFLRLLAEGVPHSGIAYATQALPLGDVVRGLLIHDVLEPGDMKQRVEFL